MILTDAFLQVEVGSRKGIAVYTANRLQRLAHTLLLYDLTIDYVQTEEFENADQQPRQA